MPFHPNPGSNHMNSLYRIRNAIIQEIRHTANISYVTVFYVPPVPRAQTQTLVLIVSKQTVIRDTYGRVLNRRSLRLGMTIDADISQAMTASMPPQARAVRITIVPAGNSYHVVLGIILQINRNTRQILVGSDTDPANLIVLNITPDTVIQNRRGQMISFSALRQGQLIRADHSIQQTFSIPPQSNALRIRVL